MTLKNYLTLFGLTAFFDVWFDALFLIRASNPLEYIINFYLKVTFDTLIWFLFIALLVALAYGVSKIFLSFFKVENKWIALAVRLFVCLSFDFVIHYCFHIYLTIT